MLGASYASDLIVAAGTSASDLAKKSSSLLPPGAAGAGRRNHYVKGGGVADNYDEDVSKMDRAQAAALVARKFAGGSGSGATAGGGGPGALAAGFAATRHRASGKRKRMLQHHLLVEDLIDTQDGARLEDADDNAMNSYVKEDLTTEKDDEEEVEEERFAIRAADGTRKKSEAKILVRRAAGDESNNRRRRSSSSSNSDSSSSSESSSSSSVSRSRTRHGRRGRGGGGRGDGRARSNSSSSSSSEDQADMRRRKAREQQRALKNQEEGSGTDAVSSVHDEAIGKHSHITKEAEQRGSRTQAKDKSNVKSADSIIESNDTNSLRIDEREQKEEARPSTNRNNHGRNRRQRLQRRSPSSSDSSTSSTSEESSSSSSSSSDDDSDINDTTSVPTMPISKPLFVPKSKRGTVTEMEMQHQKHEEFEKQRAHEAEKRAIQSRALVAAAAAAASASAGKANNMDDGDEFDTGEVGGEFIPVPDDTDPTEEDNPELVSAERNAWEVRELIRILRDVDEALEREHERRELERRRALTDEERLEEDRLSGRYRAPGEARRHRLSREDAHNSNDNGGAMQKDESSNRYLQRFHHRGAFYMDEDTLNQAGDDDVRHRAAEYSRAATGEDKIDKSALPKVMQVKKFGFAGYSTKYQGLAKEDTTDKKMDFLPIRGAAAGSSRHGRGRGR